MAEPLPAGGEALVTEEGDDYFYCEYTGETQWEKPIEADATPAPPAALSPPSDEVAEAATPNKAGSAEDDWGWGEGSIGDEGFGDAWGAAVPAASLDRTVTDTTPAAPSVRVTVKVTVPAFSLNS